MLINEIVSVKESYVEELLVAVQDLLVRIQAKGLKEISTEKFQALLAKQGIDADIESIINAVDKSGFASSVDSQKIVPSPNIPDDMMGDQEASVDVGAMAGNQAMADVKAGL